MPIYILYTGCIMWEVMPTLYWRLKINGAWTWRKAEVMIDMPGDEVTVRYPSPEVDESD